MLEDNRLPWVLGAVLVGVLLAAFILPPGALDLLPDREDPVADAGPDITINLGDVAVLDGSASSDDRGISSFEWRVEEGPNTVFLRGERVTYYFSAPGEYNATLTVTDGADKQDTDELSVIVL